MANTDHTYLGIDYGKRRIGIAKSDPTGLIASALTTLEVRSEQDALRQIAGLIEEYTPAAIVIGYPLHTSGEKSDKCVEIDGFLEKLANRYSGPIYKEDERYSSAEAADIIHAHGQRTGKDKKRIDRLAAVIILQRYLDRQPR
jgi:putative Holliday junction resolvase